MIMYEHYSIFASINRRGALGWTLMKFDGRIYWHPTKKWYSSYKVAAKMRDRMNDQLKGRSA